MEKYTAVIKKIAALVMIMMAVGSITPNNAETAPDIPNINEQEGDTSMAHYMQDIVDIELTTGSLHRSFLNHSIGKTDSSANRFGVRVFRNGNPVNLGSASCQGFFLSPQGEHILISGSTYTNVNGNEAYVILPQACYNYDGQFSLAIKLIGGGVTGTMRIVDGTIQNTYTDGAVAPTGTVPTYQEILAMFDEMVAATEAATEAAAAATQAGSKIDGILVTPTLTSGGYVVPTAPGAIQSHTRSSYSGYIPFTGDAKVYTYLLDNSTGIDVYDKNKTFIKAFTGDGAAWYDISTTGGRYFRLSNDHVSMPDAQVRYMLEIGNNLIETVDLINTTITIPTLTSGGYVIPWAPGGIATHQRSSYSDYIPFDGSGKVYTYLLENSTGIDVYDKNKTFIRAITGYGAAWYDITTIGGRYFRLTNDHVSMPDADVKVSVMFTRPSLTSGGYVIPWAPGGIAEHQRSSYSDYIPFDGDGDVYTYLLENSTGIDVYDSNKTFIRAITGDGAAWYNISTSGGKYFRLSNDHVNMPDSDVKYFINYNGAQNYNVPNIMSIYEKIVCCGDSITWGQVYTSASASRQAYNSYPDVLSILTGAECQNLGAPGYGAKDWYGRFNDQLNQNALYIVFLGTNNGLTDTISTDCQGTDPSQFANTETGNYGKILQTLKNNGKKAILIHVYAVTGSTVAITNSVIDQFAARFSFPVIELDYERVNSIYHYYPDGTGSNVVHFNDYGYCWVANDINNIVNSMDDDNKLKIFPQ